MTVGCTATTSAFALRRRTSATSPTVSPDAERRDARTARPPSCADDRDLARRDEVEALRLLPFGRSSLSPFSKTRVSNRSTSAARSAGGTASEHRRRAHEVRDHPPPAVRRELDPTSGARLGHLPRARRGVATSRIDGRRATTLAARGARESSAISPKSAPLVEPRERRVGGSRPSSSARSRLAHLELAARDDVRLGALFALLDDRVARGRR